MTPQPEHAVFYALHAAVETTERHWSNWQDRLARHGVKSTADWHLFYRAKDEYEAALLTLAEFCARMDADTRKAV